MIWTSYMYLLLHETLPVLLHQRLFSQKWTFSSAADRQTHGDTLSSLILLRPAARNTWITSVKDRGANVQSSARQYLGPLVTVADLPGRRALRSASTSRLVIPPIRLSTVGSRAFPVAAAQVWNGLPEAVILSSSLQSFWHQLKTQIFFNYRIHTWFSDCLSDIVTVVLVVTLLFRPL